ncbi:hypothetical protein HN859_05755, partial [Candidatus Parcubacteria bacterium]|nr:hypothetical protein [Candidatus Parcubacteria bacterium]
MTKQEACEKFRQGVDDLKKTSALFVDQLAKKTKKENTENDLYDLKQDLDLSVLAMEENWRHFLRDSSSDEVFVDALTKLEYRPNFERSIMIEGTKISIGDKIKDNRAGLILLVVGFQTDPNSIIGNVE